MVLSRVGGRYRVLVDDETVEASLRGRLRRKSERRVLVGDRVILERQPDGEATIESIVPRTSILKRRMPGARRRGVRSIAANVDHVVVVGSVCRPDWSPYLVDRFIAVAEANHMPVTVVINKCDLVDDVAELALPYRNAGYTVLATSVPERRGLEDLRQVLQGRVSLVTGPTGVGKSSLLNALQPGLRLRTAAVSLKSGGGRHTTVAVDMHRFGSDGFVVDTPGLRDVGLWGLEPAEVADAFAEFRPLAGRCRFDNCRHLEEPGCAIVAAVEDGAIPRSRLDSYRSLLGEAMQAARPWT